MDARDNLERRLDQSWIILPPVRATKKRNNGSGFRGSNGRSRRSSQCHGGREIHGVVIMFARRRHGGMFIHGDAVSIVLIAIVMMMVLMAVMVFVVLIAPQEG